MADFQEYVNNVLANNRQLSNQRLTVEKEIFHQDILRIISTTELGKRLVFMGGTCLRLCYGSERMSEDLDFATEYSISEKEATQLSDTIKKGLSNKYQLAVTVSKPEKETDTETWKISIVTNPGHSHIPTQKIHLDICHYKSYLKELRLVKDIYGVGSNAPLFLMTEKIEEILVDKLIAFAFRNRIKNRDLWDIYTLYCKNVKLDKEVLKQKIADKGHSSGEYVSSFEERVKEIQNEFPSDFKDELSRFLSPMTFENSILSKPEGPVAFNTILNDYSLSSFLDGSDL